MKTDVRKCPIVACRQCESFCEGTNMDVCGELLKVVTVEDRIDFVMHREKLPDWCPKKGAFRIVDDCHWCHNYVDMDDIGIHECFLLHKYVRGGCIDKDCTLEKVE